MPWVCRIGLDNFSWLTKSEDGRGGHPPPIVAYVNLQGFQQEEYSSQNCRPGLWLGAQGRSRAPRALGDLEKIIHLFSSFLLRVDARDARLACVTLQAPGHTRDPKTRDPATRDPKTRDPEGRQESERREAKRQESERREAKRQESERREAKKQESEKREAKRQDPSQL